MIYIIGAQNFIFDENIIENNTLVREKTSKQCPNGIKDNFHKYIIFLKLKLDCQPNKTTNSEAELLYRKIDEAELSLVK
jgi:hypothetical protein